MPYHVRGKRAPLFDVLFVFIKIFLFSFLLHRGGWGDQRQGAELSAGVPGRGSRRLRDAYGRNRSFSAAHSFSLPSSGICRQ